MCPFICIKPSGCSSYGYSRWKLCYLSIYGLIVRSHCKHRLWLKFSDFCQSLELSRCHRFRFSPKLHYLDVSCKPELKKVKIKSQDTLRSYAAEEKWNVATYYTGGSFAWQCIDKVPKRDCLNSCKCLSMVPKSTANSVCDWAVCCHAGWQWPMTLTRQEAFKDLAPKLFKRARCIC